MPIGPGLLESILHQKVDVFAHVGVDVRKGLDIGIDDESKAALTGNAADCFDEFDTKWCKGFLLCLGQLLATLMLESDVLL